MLGPFFGGVTAKREPLAWGNKAKFEANSPGTAQDSKLASSFHTLLLHLVRFSFRENPCWWLCVEMGLFSCSVRDWFLMKYKAADRHLQTRWKPKIPLPPLQKAVQTHRRRGPELPPPFCLGGKYRKPKSLLHLLYEKKNGEKKSHFFFNVDSWWSGLPDASAWAQKT